MKTTRPILLVVSTTLVVLLLGGGLAVKVGAAENSYNDVVTFSEILSLVLDNYVDPVDPESLMEGAYEGMLAGLDPNGAYLTAEEVADWKRDSGTAGPGISVLKGGRSLQVVAVDEGSPAQEAGVLVGDQIRAIDGQGVRDLSLAQAWRCLWGEAGTTVTLDLIHPADGLDRESVTLDRVPRQIAPYALEVRRGIALLRILDVERVDLSVLASDLDDVASRGVRSMLLDLRNLVDLNTRDATALAGLFADRAVLQLRDRGGELVETLETAPDATAWSGSVAVLVNGATAGSGEALASLLRAGAAVRILGESTYGLGAEVKLFELETGAGLLVSSALWETDAGTRWNMDGVEPDDEVSGQGDDYGAIAADQLDRAIELLESAENDDIEEGEAA